MAELKHVLADGLYDVTKNNKRVDATLKGLVAKKVLLQTAGSKRGAGSYRLNKMVVVYYFLWPLGLAYYWL